MSRTGRKTTHSLTHSLTPHLGLRTLKKLAPLLGSGTHLTVRRSAPRHTNQSRFLILSLIPGRVRGGPDDIEEDTNYYDTSALTRSSDLAAKIATGCSKAAGDVHQNRTDPVCGRVNSAQLRRLSAATPDGPTHGCRRRDKNRPRRRDADRVAGGGI